MTDQPVCPGCGESVSPGAFWHSRCRASYIKGRQEERGDLLSWLRLPEQSTAINSLAFEVAIERGEHEKKSVCTCSLAAVACAIHGAF